MMNHWSISNFSKKVIKCFVRKKENISENAEIELSGLEPDDYHLGFNECEVVLLPYNGYSYRTKMSMLFIEAVTTFKIPIVSHGTVMATELTRFNGRSSSGF